MTRTIHGEFFYGNKISAHGLESKRVDLATLAKAFDHVAITDGLLRVGEWDCVNGCEYDEDGNTYDFTYYVISDAGAHILQLWTDELVFYSDALGLYVWGVTVWGLAWEYVLTDITVVLD